MGRPVKKGWFSSYFGPATVNLNVTTTAGAEVIVDQPGTSTYTVASGQVRLVDGPVTLAAGLCKLQHNTKFVRKLDQYNAYYFDGTSAIWNDGSGVIVGAFLPAPTAAGDTEPGAPVVEPPVVTPVTATATATVDQSGGANNPGTVTAITVTNGGAGYTSVPDVDVGGSFLNECVATATVVDGVVTAISVDNAGTEYGDNVTVTIDAP